MAGILFTQAAFLIGACLLALSRFTTAEPPVFGPHDVDDYERGKFGWYPTVGYKTTDLIAPMILHRVWGPQCATDDKFIISPRGVVVENQGPVMLDDDGHMVWHDLSFRGKTSYGATIQTYRRKKYLTFWTGYDKDRGHGYGYYYMFDENYRQFKKISAPHNWMGDLHEFAITRDDTALFTSYVKTEADLTEFGGPKNGWFYDCTFQEMDIESDDILFEWKSSDHIALGDTYFPLPTKDGSGTYRNPWDYYHINSVQKDWKGNYLISSRYSHAVTYIDGKNGDALWYLGGRNNSFTDLSNGTATDFKWQHNARWVNDEHTEMTLFDNHAFTGGDPAKQPPARGLRLKIDLDNMTAETMVELYHPLGYVSESQGSLQVLDNGNLFVGYGNAPAMSEYSPEGDLLCDASFGSMFANGEHTFGGGRVMSYRAFKLPWIGRPYYEPKVLFEKKRKVMYVSWNGATEVKKWVLDGSATDQPRASQWTSVGDTIRTGFESNITVGSMDYKVFRLTALDKNNRPEGMWRVFSSGVVQPVQLHEKVEQSWSKNFFFLALGAIIAVVAATRRKIMALWPRQGPAILGNEKKTRWTNGFNIGRWRKGSVGRDNLGRHSLVRQHDDNELPDPVMFQHDNNSSESVQTPRRLTR